MHYESFANPAYATVDQSMIDVDLVIEDGAPSVRYTAGQHDSLSAGLYAAIVAAGSIGAYVAPTPTLAEQALAAMGLGLTIALSGSITLSATVFPTDPMTQTKIAAVITTLNTTDAFPGGATSYPMRDVSGTWHTLTISQYEAVAGAIAAFAAALILIVDGNPLQVAQLPASSVSLAV